MNLNATLFAQAAAFALFIWVTVKFIWPMMQARIDARQKTIADGLAAAEQGRRTLELSTRQADEAIKEARARAADSLAQAEKRSALATVAGDSRGRQATADPQLSDAQRAGLFIAILSGRLSGEAENFVRVLAQNDRLTLLPQIREQFEVLKNEREGVMEATVESAFELTDAQLKDLVA